jgi:membrane protease YdiL (CAAX protease family)
VVNSLLILHGLYVGFTTGNIQATEEGVSGGTVSPASAALPPEYMYLASVIAVAACGILFFFWYRRETQGELHGSYQNVFKTKYIVLFAVLGIGCQLFFSGLMNLITPLFEELFNEYSATMQSLTSGNMFVVLLLMTVVAPISEELIFRGVILHMANRYIAFIGANVLQAVFFGIYHGNIVQGIYAALLGFLLGVIYRKFKSIVAPIVLHILINISSYLMYLFPDTMTSYIITFTIGGISVIASLYFIQPTRRASGLIQEEHV